MAQALQPLELSLPNSLYVHRRYTTEALHSLELSLQNSLYVHRTCMAQALHSLELALELPNKRSSALVVLTEL